MNAAADLIAGTALRGVLLGACVWLALRLLRVSSAELRHRVLLLAFLALLAMPCIIAVCAGWKVLPALTTEPVPVFKPESLPVIVSSPTPPRETGPTLAMQDDRARPRPRQGFAEPEVRTVVWPLRSYLPRWQTTVVGVWSVGALLCLLAIARAGWRLCSLVRDCEPADEAQLAHCAELAGRKLSIKLRVTNNTTGPMVAGFFRPVLVLPEDFFTWEHDRARAVLLHELAHAHRRDGLLHLLAAITCALHWCNPFAWWMLRRLQHEAECACDNAVLAAAMPAHDYAGHLLAVATGEREVMALAPSMARPSGLRHRVQAVLSNQVRRGAVGRATGLLVVLGTLAAGLPMMLAQQAAPKPAAPKSVPPSTEQPKVANAKPTPPAEQPKADKAAPSTAASKATIEVTTVDENDQPLADAELRLFRMDRPGPVKPLEPDVVAHTDAQGRWQGELPFGEFMVSATQGKRVAAFEKGQTWWYPSKKNPALKPKLVLRPGGTLEVLVQDAATQKPIPGAPVYLDSGLAVKADPQGLAVLSPVSSGEHTVMAVSPPYADKWIDINLQGTSTMRQPISLVPGFAVVGRVVDEKGAPVKNAEVRDNYSGSTFLLATRHAVTGEDGRYQLGWYSKAKPLWSFQVEHKAFAELSVSALPPPTEGDLVTHDFFLDKGSEIAGVVKDTEGKPVKGASIRYGSSWSLVGMRWANSDADGAFRITKIGRKESREIVVEAKGYAPAWLSAAPGKGDQVPQLAFSLTPGLKVKGRVVDAKGRPVTGVTLSTRAMINGRSEYCGPRVGVNEQGEFVLESQPATGAALDAYGGGVSAVRNFKFDPTKPLVVTVDRPGVIRGRVVDAVTGEPIQRFTARLDHSKAKREAGEPSASYSAHLSLRGQACQAADGGFVIEDLITRASHALFIEAEGYALWQRDVVKAAPEDDKAWPLEIKLERGVALAVQVVDAVTGDGLPGATVYFAARDLDSLQVTMQSLLSGEPRDYGDGGQIVIQSAGPEGRSELHFPSGTTQSTLVVRAEKHPPVLLKDVHRGEGSVLRIEMTPEARIKGTVAGLPGFDPAKDTIRIQTTSKDNQDIKVAPDGRFDAGSLPAGSVIVSTNSGGDGTTLASYIAQVHPGVTTEVDLVSDAKASLTVIVTKGGKPSADMAAYLVPAASSPLVGCTVAEGRSNGDGVIQFKRLPAIEARLLVRGVQAGLREHNVDLRDTEHPPVLRIDL